MQRPLWQSQTRYWRNIVAAATVAVPELNRRQCWLGRATIYRYPPVRRDDPIKAGEP